MRANILATLVAFLLLLPGAASCQSTRPGDAPYIPTKLEWAALELQAASGATVMTRESPLMVNFIAQPDGVTILCLLQYTPDFEAAALKVNRDSVEQVFDLYRKSRGWTWMRLRFQEKVSPRPWPR